MILVLISDTHGKHNELTIPACDVLIHAGDYTSVGSPQDIANFYQWLAKQEQCTHKIFIEGNHELMGEDKVIRKYPQTSSYKDWIAYLALQEPIFKEKNIHRLYNSEVIIDGVKFWGSPYTLAFYNWAFNMTSEELQENWKNCPNDTDVLISHGPALEKLDLCANGHKAGDPWLGQKVIEIKPKIHVFGHIHESFGQMTIGVEEEKQTLVVNASVLNEYYEVVNEPVIITI